MESNTAPSLKSEPHFVAYTEPNNNNNNNNNKTNNNNNNNRNAANADFTIDSCYSASLQRLDVGSLPSYWNYDEADAPADPGALYTFEEFIQREPPSAPASTRGTAAGALQPQTRYSAADELATISTELAGEMLNERRGGGGGGDNHGGRTRMGHGGGGGGGGERYDGRRRRDENVQEKQQTMAHDLNKQQSTTPATTTTSTTTTKHTSSRQFKLFGRIAKRSSAYEITQRSQQQQQKPRRPLRNVLSAATAATAGADRRAAAAAADSATDGGGGGASTSTILRQTFCPTVSGSAGAGGGKYGNHESGGDNASVAYAYYGGENLSANDGMPPQNVAGARDGGGAPTSTKFSFRRAFGEPEFDAVPPPAGANDDEDDAALARTAEDDDGAGVVGEAAGATVVDHHQRRAAGGKPHAASEGDGGEGALGGFLLSKLLCCFRATVHIVEGRRQRRYELDHNNNNNNNNASGYDGCNGNGNGNKERYSRIGDGIRPSTSKANVNAVANNNPVNNNSKNNNNNKRTTTTNAEQKCCETPPAKYSWDVLRAEEANNNNNNHNNDDSNYCIANCTDQILLRTPGQIGGQQFSVENCANCIIVVLDNSASITVDDCQNCIIVLGPCRGSVFVRDSVDCAIFAMCQQFRARDCRRTSARLFCATAPTIEDSSVEFGALTICYNNIEEQMALAELSPVTNNWWRVHNFTPESAKFTLADVDAIVEGEDAENLAPNFALNAKFEREFLHALDQNRSNLTFRPSVSFFFRVAYGEQKRIQKSEEKVLFLAKSFDKRTSVKNAAELYHDVRRLLKRLLLASGGGEVANDATAAKIRLLGLYDVDLRAGEFETLLRLKPNHHSPGGKLVAVEVCGGADWVRRFCTEALAYLGNPPNVEMVEASQSSANAQQLSRFAEAQNSV